IFCNINRSIIKTKNYSTASNNSKKEMAEEIN
ncbi:hypothetical protein SEEM038_17381, partial [Salmonella enterica subsp. enterica serovar Senftenberg str. NC_MB012510-0038]